MIEIISRILELAETCQEGLEYARDALGRGMAGDSLAVRTLGTVLL